MLDHREFTIIAHRGYSSKAPENTMSAFDLALEKGFPHIEFDVSLTKDEVPIVFHDEAVDRTTNKEGKVIDFTLADIRNMDAGSWFGEKYKDEVIPTLEHVLSKLSPKSHMHIELKSYEENLPNLVAKELINQNLDKSNGDFDVPGVTVTSFSLSHLIKSKELLPELSHGWLVMEVNDEVIGSAKQNGIDQLCPLIEGTKKDSIDNATKEGFSIRCWGVKKPEDVLKAMNVGAHGATSNWPEESQNYIK